MALILKRCFEGYENMMKNSDPRLNGYFLMGSPVQISFISVLYLLFVFKVGPAYMENRKPMQLKILLIIYNIIQIFANGTIIVTTASPLVQMSVICSPIDYNEDMFTNLSYTYILLKVLDYLDTVFFILKKNFRQVTFLHVYHHIIMVLAAYIGGKYYMGGHTFYMPYINAIVHTVMYSYYLLTVIYPELKNNLTFKKRITQLQLVQFGALLCIYSPNVFIECEYPKHLSFLVIIQSVVMIALFGDFYYRTYIRKKQVKKAM